MNTDQRQPKNLKVDPELLARVLRLVAPTPTRRLRSDRVRAELRALVEPRWQENAACATADPEAWFPAKGSRPAGQVTRICAACPVSRSCLAVGMLWNEDGIWAGTSPNHRKHGYRLLRLGSSAAEVIELLLTRGEAGTLHATSLVRGTHTLDRHAWRRSSATPWDRRAGGRMNTPTAPVGAGPVVTPAVVRDYAAEAGVCVRPLLRTVTDRGTGSSSTVVIACGSTRESKCPPCAAKARRLRMQQCAEGWHLAEDPLPPKPAREEEDEHQVDDDLEQDEAGGSARRVRSTRRRSDAAELPKVPQEHRTVGRTFTARDGTSYRPSMFVTLTLGSDGKVIPGQKHRHVPGAGSPLRPESYDYRRAAVEAMFFTRLFDRWVQNLRRCAGYKVQYFGAIEPQRRLAPHIHVAMRGAIPRQVIRKVTKATYLQLWWPSFDKEVYPDPDRQPWWDEQEQSYRCPETGIALPSWEEALDELDADPTAQPAVVMRFGTQLDVQGIIAPSEDADRSIRYLTKYLTKDIAETYTAPDATGPDPAYEAHIDRLFEQVRVLPCSPECSNWLRYGVTPKDAGPDLDHGFCPSAAHQRENLGLGGRRVQVSRAWSGKTLSEHKADRATVVRAVLQEAGIEAPDADRMAADVLAEDGLPRYVWEDVPVVERDYVTVVMGSVLEAKRWRREYQEAKQQQAEARASPASA